MRIEVLLFAVAASLIAEGVWLGKSHWHPVVFFIVWLAAAFAWARWKRSVGKIGFSILALVACSVLTVGLQFTLSLGAALIYAGLVLGVVATVRAGLEAPERRTVAVPPFGELAENLTLERYKFITDRQKYFTELARESFVSYSRLFSGLAAGAILLVSTRARLEFTPDILQYLIHGIAYLISFLGVVASLQILFCLARWQGYRTAEREINSSSPPIRWWWWMFEALYIFAILFTIGAVWHIAIELPNVLP